MALSWYHTAMLPQAYSRNLGLSPRLWGSMDSGEEIAPHTLLLKHELILVICEISTHVGFLFQDQSLGFMVSPTPMLSAYRWDYGTMVPSSQ